VQILGAAASFVAAVATLLVVVRTGRISATVDHVKTLANSTHENAMKYQQDLLEAVVARDGVIPKDQSLPRTERSST
jgi:hypothetical protein